jgi:hypothetical protein
MNTIDIGTVLNKFDDTYDERDSAVKEYGIRFITEDGRLRTMRCRKGVKAPRQQLTEGGNQERGKFRYNLKRNGTILVHDLDINESRSPKVAMICQFKDFNSNTWLKVYH